MMRRTSGTCITVASCWTTSAGVPASAMRSMKRSGRAPGATRPRWRAGRNVGRAEPSHGRLVLGPERDGQRVAHGEATRPRTWSRACARSRATAVGTQSATSIPERRWPRSAAPAATRSSPARRISGATPTYMMTPSPRRPAASRASAAPSPATSDRHRPRVVEPGQATSTPVSNRAVWREQVADRVDHGRQRGHAGGAAHAEPIVSGAAPVPIPRPTARTRLRGPPASPRRWPYGKVGGRGRHGDPGPSRISEDAERDAARVPTARDFQPRVRVGDPRRVEAE